MAAAAAATASAVGAATAQLYPLIDKLIDAMSELAIASVTNDYSKAGAQAQAIAAPGQEMLKITQAVATASNDAVYQDEVVQAINGFAAAIKAVVATFTAMAADKDSKPTKLKFAEATRDLGDAIAVMVEVTDEVSSKQVLRAAKAAVDGSKALGGACDRGADMKPYVKALTKMKDGNAKLGDMCTKAAAHTPNITKKRLMDMAARKLARQGDALVEAARRQRETGGVRADVDAAIAELGDTYREVIRAARMPSSLSRKAHETYEYLRKLIEGLKELQTKASELYTTARDGGTRDDVRRRADDMIKTLDTLIPQAEKVIAATDDEAKKRKLRAGVQELRDGAAALTAAADAAAASPDDAHAKARLDVAFDRMERAIADMLEMTGADAGLATTKGKLAATSQSLEDAAQRTVDHSKAGASKDMLDAAKDASALAQQFERDARRVAAEARDAKKKAAIQAGAGEVKALTADLIGAGKELVADPNNAQKRMKVDRAHQRLLGKIREVGQHAGIGPAGDAAELPGADGWPDTTIRPGDTDLIRAAKEEVAHARALAKEAELMAQNETDPERKRKILAACEAIRTDSHDLIAKAYELSDDPFNYGKKQAFGKAQRQLAKDVRDLVVLTTPNPSDEMQAALRAMDSAAGSAGGGGAGGAGDAHDDAMAPIRTLQAMIDDLFKLLENAENLSPEQLVATAKKISDMTKKLAGELNALAKNTEDPELKQQLVQGARIAKDKAMQIKIVAAVQASAGKDGVNNMGPAVRGLRTECSGILKAVQQTGLQREQQAAKEQSAAISNVVRSWRKQHGR